MEKKRLFVTFLILIVGVVILAFLTKLWLKSSGLEQKWTKKQAKPAVVRTLGEKGILEPIVLSSKNGCSFTIG